jgi:hypothetical protein
MVLVITTPSHLVAVIDPTRLVISFMLSRASPLAMVTSNAIVNVVDSAMGGRASFLPLSLSSFISHQREAWGEDMVSVIVKSSS